MSILIRGMETPTSCDCCPLCGCFVLDDGTEENYRCCATMRVLTKFDKRDERCPLIELPPHGRLKRRLVYRGEVYNALESARVNALDGILSDPYKEGFHDGIKRAIQILANEVDDAPTIIPAEEGE